MRQIVEQRLAAKTNETWQSLAAFLDECESPGMRGLVTEAVAEDRQLPNPDRQLVDVVTYLRNQFLDRQIAASIQRAEPAGSAGSGAPRIAAPAAGVASAKTRALARALK